MTTLREKTSSLVDRTAAKTHKMAQEPQFIASPDSPDMTSASSTDATQVIWQDPSSYDPYLHGPPYLPSARIKAASEVFNAVNAARGTETAGLLVFLRAVAMVHQTHHWVTTGPSSYADHLLFERLYNDMLPEIDAIAERTVGGPGSTLVGNFREQAEGVVRVLDTLGTPAEDALGMVQKSLEAEELLRFGISKVVEGMRAESSLSRGTDNLIAGIEDKHEEHVYLLQQRLSESSAV